MITDNWFTIEEIDDSTYAISEHKHWEETHCYLLIGTEKAVLIDTGLGVSDIRAVVEQLTKLPVLVITTHAHWDHIGGHAQFKEIAVHQAEIRWLNERFPIPLEVVKSNLLKENCEFPVDFEIENYQIFRGEPEYTMTGGEEISLGDRKIRVIHTPGHSPGHVCIYEPLRQYLFTGDLVYQGCLYAFYPSTDPVAFMESVQRIRSLPIKRILPGHHALDIQLDIINRIAEGFDEIRQEGKLVQGSGIFVFKDFSIHI